MWDRLFTDCRIATMEAAPGNPLGTIENGAIGIQDGRIVRVGTRTEMAGNRAAEVLPLSQDGADGDCGADGGQHRGRIEEQRDP